MRRLTPAECLAAGGSIETAREILARDLATWKREVAPVQVSAVPGSAAWQASQVKVPS